MMSRIVLCADSETMRQPALLGLSGENLAAQDWLALVHVGRGSARVSAQR